ncbi:MAG: ABC transporter substrate-binding protein [Treponema sp.]|jgi:putative aldouronate transport system substrate-binding protein|nr:ABC transporter substrate-binding protein [Treponema sp.]
MKKAFFIMLAVTVVFSAAVFAGGRSQTGGTGTTVPGYTGSLPYAEFDWYIGNNPQPDDQMVHDALNAYIGPKINAKVNVHYMPTADWETRMTVMVTSGQDLGIIGFGSQSKLDYLIQSQRGSFYPIENLLNQYGTGTKALFNQGVWDAMTLNGHIYGIPSLKDNCYIISFIYNEELAQKLGVDAAKVPYTAGWYKLESWLNDVKAKRDQVLGANIEEPLISDTALEMPYNFALNTLLNDSFLAVTNIDGIMDIAGYDSKTIFNLYATQEYRDFAHAQWRMVQKNILAYDYTDKTEWTYTGNMFGFVGWGYTYLPEHLNGDAYTTRMVEPARVWTDTQNYYSAGTAISAASKNPERAMMFLELVNTDPVVATMMRFGVEGQHYKKDAQGKMTFEGTRNANAAERGYYLWYNAPVGNLTIVQAPEDHSGPNGIMFTKMNQFNRDAKQPAYMGFSFNIQPVSNEIAACTNVVMEYRETLRRGQAGSEAEVDRLIDEFNAKLKANGIDKILAEAQKQADAFLASR